MLEQKQSDDPSDDWVDNLAQEEDFLCVAFKDDDHEWTTELKHRDRDKEPYGSQSNADACDSCSFGSGLVHV